MAQWSLNKSINEGILDPYDFAKVASEYGFSGLEYVTQLVQRNLQLKQIKTKAIGNFCEKKFSMSPKNLV